MKHDNAVAKAQLWIALGNQPGAGIWFALWQLTRRNGSRRPRVTAEHLSTRQRCPA